MPTAPVIEVKDLRKTYHSGTMFRRSHEALRGVTFQVKPGEVFALLGPNGAGKTTFINVMLGIVRKTGGTAMLLGLPAGRKSSRLRVGYLPENLRLPRHLNAITAMDYYGGLSGMTRKEIKAKRGELLERVGLADRARDSVRKYSKGMQQRLGLAQALLHDPDLLFLDEPTDGLDPVGRNHVRTLLQELKAAGKTVFLNSHLLQEVEMVSDRVAILDRGVLRGIGTVEEIAAGQPQHVEVAFDVAGSAEAIRTALANRQLERREQLDQRHTRLILRLPDQQAVDALVDDLRSQQVSIVSIARRRASLEEAFLNLLAQPAELA